MVHARQRAFLPVLLFVGTVVAVVSSLGAPLIPQLAAQLHVSISAAQWALTATLVVAAVASPITSRLGDGRHRKRLIIGGLALVSIGGVMAAVASSLPLLIAGRGLQGFGFALMPLAMAVARDHLPPERARRAVASLSVMGAVGVGFGYPISGIIADHGGVSAAYWFGSAVTLVALVLAVWAIPHPSSPPERQHIDVPGAALIGLGLVALLIALDKGADWGWGAPTTLVLLVSGIVVMGGWACYELRLDHPLVDLRLLHHRAVLTATGAGLLISVIMYVSMVTITQFVQQPTFGLGQDIFVAGLTIVPLSVVSSGLSRTVPWLENRVGARPIIPAGCVVFAVAMLFFAATTSRLWQAFVTMGIIGVGLGYTFAAMPGLIVGAVPPDQTSSAMGLYQVARLIGAAVGSGLAITMLQAFGTDGQPTLGSYRSAFLATASLAVVTAFVAWWMPGRTSVVRSEEVEAYEIQDGRLAAAGLEDLTEPAPY